MQLQTIEVQLGERGYPVLIGKGILSRIGSEVAALQSGDRSVILTVEGVRKLYGGILEESLACSGISASVMEVPDREEAKTLSTYSEVVKGLLARGARRDSIIVALGGGCVGDLAGFVAATYMRGVRLIHVPTTLLAQVDSSIGGKAALNLSEGKNVIGAFHQPSLVLSDIGVLKTLPIREVKCGVAELIKYGAIMDIRLLEFLEEGRDSVMGLEEGAMLEAVSSAVKLKAMIVSKDETESAGLRTILNFGHTIGHAVEAAMEYCGYSHGEAVAVGMVCEMRLAESLGLCTEEEADRLERIISSYGLPTRLAGVDPARVMGLMKHDKKVKSGRWRFALPKGLGNSTVVSDPPRDAVADALKGVMKD